VTDHEQLFVSYIPSEYYRRSRYHFVVYPQRDEFCRSALVLRPYPGKTYICENIALSQTGKGFSNPWYVFSLNGDGYWQGMHYAELICYTKHGYPAKFMISKDTSNESNVFYVSGPADDDRKRVFK